MDAETNVAITDHIVTCCSW